MSLKIISLFRHIYMPVRHVIQSRIYLMKPWGQIFTAVMSSTKHQKVLMSHKI